MKPKRKAKEAEFARLQGRRIYDLRNELPMSRRELSDRTGLNQQLIYRIEMGESTANAYELDALARALDASRDQLFPSHEVIPFRAKTQERRLWAVIERCGARRAYA